ncbi:MAG TPA: hemolysin family protein [Gemmataceae bacterium]|nr:hemolysin family protein [Gemmataceae bacterium]
MHSAAMLLGDLGTWVVDLLGLLTIPALVALNGLFVAAEFALVSTRKTRVEEMVSLGMPAAKSLQSAVSRLDRSIAATQLGITLASIGLGWVGEPALARLLQPFFHFLESPWKTFAAHSTATATAFLLITFVHVTFGELIPKNVALQRPDRLALWLAAPLLLFAKLTRPFTLVMSETARLILRWWGVQPAHGEEMVHSVEELALLIEDTEEAGILEPDQAEFVQNVFRLSGKRVGDCLVPREKMATLELNTPPDKVLEAVRTGAHTRMPVYEGALDNIVGIVNTKDLFYLFSLRGVVVLEDAMYAPLFLKPDESVATALRLFRQSHRPMALVRSAEGMIHGLITLEDVLEEIVGDIEDEHDRPTPKLRPRIRRQPVRPSTALVVANPPPSTPTRK